MKKKIIRLLIATSFFVVPGTTAFAQDERKVVFAALASGNIQYQLVPSSTGKYGIFGAAGIGIAAKIAGSTELSMSLLPKLLLMENDIVYSQVPGLPYTVSSLDVVFNPEVMIPTRYERLQVTAGIGIDWMAGMDISVRSSNDYQTYANVDAAYDTVYAARRTVIPFATLGLLYKASKKVQVELSLRQDVLNAFPSASAVTFSSGVYARRVALNYQPTRLVIGVSYWF